MHRSRLLRPALALAAFPVAVACGPKAGVGVAPLRPGPAQIRYEQTRPSMGGLLVIRIVAPESRERKVERTLEKAFAAAAEWEAILSASKPESHVSRINAAAGIEPVAVPQDVIDAFKKGVTISHASKGTFDATIDWTKIGIDEVARTVFLPESGMKISFDGMGRGIGADAAATVLREEGFDDFVVDLSGDAYFAGDAGGESWKAAIQDPSGPRGTVVATLAVRDGAVASSGLSGVTVLASDVTTADAWGTAASAAGPVEGLALLRARGLDAVLISAPEEGRPAVLTATEGLKDVLDVSAWKGEIQWVARGH